MGNFISIQSDKTGAPPAPTSDDRSEAIHRRILPLGAQGETESVCSIATAQLRQCLATIQDDEKREYSEALALVPELVEMESNPIRFLRLADFNPWLAARSICEYWSERKTIFGDELAFRPMMQSTQYGALAEEDVRLLHNSDAIQVAVDSNDRSVVLLDAVWAIKHSDSLDGLLRCIFYVLSVCAEKESSQRDGITFLVFADAEHFSSADDTLVTSTYFFDKLLDLVRHGMPVRIASVHCMSLAEVNSEEGTRKDLTSLKGCQLRYMSHQFGSKEELVAWLSKSFGLTDKLLPPSIGPEGESAKSQKWHKDRLDVEMERYESDQLKKSALKAVVISNEPGDVKQAAASSSLVPSIAKADSQSVASASVSSDQGAKGVAGKRKHSDSGLSEDATVAAAASVDDESSRIEFIRKRNALYSRRKYHRKKIEMEVLQRQSAELKRQNVSLKKEEQRLQQLILEAETHVARASQSGNLLSMNSGNAGFLLGVSGRAAAGASLLGLGHSHGLQAPHLDQLSFLQSMDLEARMKLLQRAGAVALNPSPLSPYQTQEAVRALQSRQSLLQHLSNGNQPSRSGELFSRGVSAPGSMLQDPHDTSLLPAASSSLIQPTGQQTMSDIQLLLARRQNEASQMQMMNGFRQVAPAAHHDTTKGN